MESKSRLRRRLRRARMSLSASERSRAEDLVAARALGVLADLDGPIALYAAHGSELSVARLAVLLINAGRVLAYPRVGASGLTFHRCGPEALTAGYRGILEPPAAAAELELSQLSAVVVPGVGFDVSGGRLGQGGGFYDRALAASVGLRLGVCFDVQVTDAPVPREPHDVNVDVVVTEHRVARDGKWMLDSGSPTR